jgi:predicted 3-demethylubiquinone-9 3-methyltransferase (glyoxalase superfamily)
MTHSIYPALRFKENAKTALEWYCSIFPNSHIMLEHDPAVKAQLAGVPFLGINGGPPFTINPSISFMVICETRSEIDHYWNQLSKDGSALMELGQYPWSDYYGWLQDQHGFSWQLYLGKLSDVNQQKIVPTLMYCGTYQGKCQAALNFYQSLFKNFRTQGILKYTEGEYAGQVKHAQVIANDFTLMAMDSGTPQNFEFSEGVSLVIECENQAEIDYYWDGITLQGTEDQCSWCKDQFGVSWQIVPKNLWKILMDNPHALGAIFKMKKLVIEDLIQAQ